MPVTAGVAFRHLAVEIGKDTTIGPLTWNGTIQVALGAVAAYVVVLIGQMLISAPRRVSDRGSQAALLGGLTATILVVVQSDATLGDGLLAACAMALLHLLVVHHVSSNGQGQSHLVYYDDAWLTPTLDACGVAEVELQEAFERLDDRSEVEAVILLPDGSIRALFRDGRSAVSRRAGNGYRDWTYPGPPS